MQKMLGFELKNIFVINGSKNESTKATCLFFGFGKEKE